MLPAEDELALLFPQATTEEETALCSWTRSIPPFFLCTSENQKSAFCSGTQVRIPLS